MKIYFGGPLFSESERGWIRCTIKKIEALARDRGADIEIIFPYDVIAQSEIRSLGTDAKREIFSGANSISKVQI
ncbi:MAG TPA: hypothetical protein VEF34_10555 [Syntrophobacteraceae bacterium]|nr:hypothetical protein [Syntrophobacteraceae bacterium]